MKFQGSLRLHSDFIWKEEYSVKVPAGVSVWVKEKRTAHVLLRGITFHNSEIEMQTSFQAGNSPERSQCVVISIIMS